MELKLIGENHHEKEYNVDHVLKCVYKQLVVDKSHRKQPKNSPDLSRETMKQVRLDCARSFGDIAGINDTMQRIYQDELYALIVDILSHDASELHYYQGYNDVVSLFLLYFSAFDETNTKLEFKIVSNREELVNIVLNFTHNYLSDFMKKDINDTVIYLSYIPKVLKKINYSLYKNITTTSKELAFKFTLSNIITLFNHDIDSDRRLYNLLIVKHLLQASNISFVLILYAVLLDEISEEVSNLLAESETSHEDELVTEFKINNMVNKYLNSVDVVEFEALLSKTDAFIGRRSIQNVFKYSLKNKHMLINFDFESEKNALVKFTIVSANLLVLGKLQSVNPQSLHMSIFTSVFSIYTVYRTFMS